MALNDINLLPYDVQTINSLPTLEEAELKLRDRLVKLSEVCSIAGDIYKKSGLLYTFGLTLLHKPFDLSDNEKLISFGNFAVPMNPDPEFAVIPCSWRFTSDGSTTPYEFAKTGRNLADLPGAQTLLAQLSSYLVDEGLQDLFGVCLLPAGWEAAHRKPRVSVIGNRVVRKEIGLAGLAGGLPSRVGVVFGSKLKSMNFAFETEVLVQAVRAPPSMTV
ncbi:hypothetical protein EV356DRAFT_575209 [Viridothelium virens]|uniref:Uncharacterized protein n=1 Tax=Viridothelium virens TaxID=1048519 RepID=A0A6A6HFK7_VIRVR|nr:hypothetical protein EV356DRAFT_575209 [Viridothelium virens]